MTQIQTALSGQPRRFTLMKPKTRMQVRQNPWTGICCEACWHALEKRCRCRCGGKYHGHGLKGKDQRLGEEAEEETEAI